MKLLLLTSIFILNLYSNQSIEYKKELIETGNTDIILSIEGLDNKLKTMKEIYNCMIKKEQSFRIYAENELRKDKTGIKKEINYLNKILNVSLFEDLKKSKTDLEFKKIIQKYNKKYSDKCKTNSCHIVFNKYTKTVKNIDEFKRTIQISTIEELFIPKFKTLKRYCMRKVINLD